MKDTVNALAKDGTVIRAKDLTMDAGNDLKVIAASGAIGVSGKSAVAVNGLVNVLKTNTLTELNGRATLAGAARITAHSDRDVVNAVASVNATGRKSVV